MKVGIREAKTHLSRLLTKVANGEEVVIVKGGVPIAKIVPIKPPKKNRVFGQDRGKGFISNDFDDPLPDDILKFFT